MKSVKDLIWDVARYPIRDSVWEVVVGSMSDSVHNSVRESVQYTVYSAASVGLVRDLVWSQSKQNIAIILTNKITKNIPNASSISNP